MDTAHELIIIGGGAAGLGAAVYALDKRIDALVIYDEVGGKAGTQQHIQGQRGEEYLAGAEAVQLFERRVTTHSSAILRDQVVDLAKSGGIFKIETRHHGTLSGRAVILATGAAPVRLDVPGARELLDQGIGYSITTHARLVDGKPVAIVGTTRRALQGASELARSAAHVYVIAPDATGMTSPLAQSLRRLPNVEVMQGYWLAEITGQDNVEQIAIEREGERSYLKVVAIFAALGLLPNSGIARRIAAIDADGFVVVDNQNATTLPGLFAAGDVTTAFGENMLIAIGEGARAAASAYEYISTLCANENEVLP
jgi:thioredoxin reductase (NADPH)